MKERCLVSSGMESKKQSKETLSKTTLKMGDGGVLDIEEKIKSDQAKEFSRYLEGKAGTLLLRKLVAYYGGLKSRPFNFRGVPIVIEALVRGPEYHWHIEPRVEARFPFERWKRYGLEFPG